MEKIYIEFYMIWFGRTWDFMMTFWKTEILWYDEIFEKLKRILLIEIRKKNVSLNSSKILFGIDDNDNVIKL